MKCVHCGANIPDDQMICPVCGAEVQIVPDYNPLDDLLAREVRGSVEGTTRQIRTDDIRRYRREESTKNINATRVLSEDEMARLRADRRKNANNRRNTSDPRRQKTGEFRDARSDTAELRRQRQARQQKRLEAARRKRRRLLLAMAAMLVLIGVGIYVAYQNSYTGMMKKGYRAVTQKEYIAAEKYFDRAIIKDKSKPDAYGGLAKIYIDQNDLEGAEDIYINAIKTQPTNIKLYRAAIDFYMETEQPEKVALLLEDCEDKSVLDAVSEYVCEAPEFKPEEGTYQEVQEIMISSDTKGDIYYTLDGTDPTVETGIKYKEPILLEKEETTEIRAIVVNKKGIPSGVVSQSYTIEFPIADAPAVTPSTGRYTDPQKITITVPDGYTAYYTTDGSNPTSSSSKYEGPIAMPANTTTTFNAVLINNRNGKETAVTTRSYITVIE